MKFSTSLLLLLLIIMQLASCRHSADNLFTGAENEVKIITLNPGHFHAALIQKEMYRQVHPQVHVYAPETPDVELHMRRIESFNTRQENPTSWNTEIYLGDDFLEKMIAERKGNVVVLAGNNRKKTNGIYRSVEAGLNVLADKPMVIDSESFALLEKAFEVAENNNVLLYDIMTERYEITSRLQREIAQNYKVFGTLVKGTPENPAVVKESVHHFFKYVAGSVLQRPPWYFDVNTQGEGIIDVTTHLVDLIQWICFPDVVINYKTDVEVYDAKRWTTAVTVPQFLEVTGLNEVPDYLHDVIDDNNTMQIFANGETHYTLKGLHAKVSVVWDYAAPEGGGDTHFSVMRGSKSDLIIRQGSDEGFVPMLFIVPADKNITDEWKNDVLDGFLDVTEEISGIVLAETSEGFRVDVPDYYRIGHEAHFAEVAEKYLQFLVDGKLPEWEVPNMLAKYYTNTKALEIARKK